MNKSEVDKSFPEQKEIDTLLEGFKFTYPNKFVLEKAGFSCKLQGFGGYADENQLEFDIFIIDLNRNIFDFSAQLCYNDSDGNEKSVISNSLNTITGIPSGSKCTLSIKIKSISAREKTKPDYSEIVSKGTVQDSLDFMDRLKTGKNIISYSSQIMHFFKKGNKEQKIAAAHCIKNICTELEIEPLLKQFSNPEQLFANATKSQQQKSFEPAEDKHLAVDQPQKLPTYAFELPYVLAAVEDVDWKWDKEQTYNGLYGEVSMASGKHIPSGYVFLRVITAVDFPEDMVAVYLKENDKMPAFFIGLQTFHNEENVQNEKVGKINLNFLISLNMISNEFIGKPNFFCRPFAKSEMNSKLKDIIANSQKSSNDDLQVFKEYYEYDD